MLLFSINKEYLEHYFHLPPLTLETSPVAVDLRGSPSVSEALLELGSDPSAALLAAQKAAELAPSDAKVAELWRGWGGTTCVAAAGGGGRGGECGGGGGGKQGGGGLRLLRALREFHGYWQWQGIPTGRNTPRCVVPAEVAQFCAVERFEVRTGKCQSST